MRSLAWPDPLFFSCGPRARRSAGKKKGSAWPRETSLCVVILGLLSHAFYEDETLYEVFP